jgi:hypothetical protein
MHRAEFEENVGAGNICESINDALARAQVLCPIVKQFGHWAANWGRRVTDMVPANVDSTSS